MIVLISSRKQCFLLHLNCLEFFQESLFVGHGLSPLVLHCFLNCCDLLFIQIRLSSEFFNPSLTFSVLSLKVLNSAKSSLELFLIILDPSFELSVCLFSFLNLPTDIFFERETFTTLPLN